MKIPYFISKAFVLAFSCLSFTSINATSINALEPIHQSPSAKVGHVGILYNEQEKREMREADLAKRQNDKRMKGLSFEQLKTIILTRLNQQEIDIQATKQCILSAKTKHDIAECRKLTRKQRHRQQQKNMRKKRREHRVPSSENMEIL